MVAVLERGPEVSVHHIAQISPILSPEGFIPVIACLKGRLDLARSRGAFPIEGAARDRPKQKKTQRRHHPEQDRN